MRLFTKTDLERAARLAAQAEFDTHEACVAYAVETVAAEVEPVYARETVERVAREACELLEAKWFEMTAEDAVEQAMRELR